MTRTIPASRRLGLGAALAASAVLGVGLLSACSAGQITQTDTQVAAVPGISAQSKDGLIALREAVVAYSDGYKAGSVVPIEVRLFNNARQSVKLTSVTAGSAGTVVLVGGQSAAAAPVVSSAPPSPAGSPSGSKSASSSPSATKSPTPSPTPAAVGSSKISVEIPVNGFVALSQGTKTYLAVEKLTGETLPAGAALADVTFTFTYADGTTTTINLPELPMTVPASPLPKPSSVVGHEEE
ncbi:hypothetical protein ACFO1B_53450 [Dactylosporangium siamense]|uniref:Lipoprotein n=1 Tax=Dactylosporangium siamense TaxID=685454 RepID=A0A919PYM3_9ACTN|nr:hypothetical protein [Dactylosporangium siamense]GIG52759.1 hypothetical protein Dsi01nite_108000 [Dactylosporangium siamense]